jgi:hypothetical protein
MSRRMRSLFPCMSPEYHRRDTLPRANGAEWVQALILSANLAWTTLCLGGYRAETMGVTILLTGLLAAVGLARGLGKRFAAHPASLWLWPFIIYGAANVFWISPVPWLGWFDWAKWLQMAVIFWVVVNHLHSAGARRLVFFTIVSMAVIGVGFAGYQRFVNPTWLPLGAVQVDQFHHRSSGPFGAPNSFAGLLVLLLPVTGALMAQRGATPTERVGWGWVTLVLLAGLALTISRGAWIALALALTVWPLIGAGDWRWSRRLGMAAGVVVLLLMVGALVSSVAPKTRERFEVLLRDSGERSRPILWQAAGKLVREAPVWGAGAGSYDVLFERHRPVGFVDRPEWTHNDYLNTVSDYGVVGGALLAGGVWMTLRESRRREVRRSRSGNPWIDQRFFRQALGIGVLAFALQLFVDFHLKIPALGLAFATIAGLALGRERRKSQAAPGRLSPFMPWLGVAAVVAVLMGLNPFYRAEGRRDAARHAIERMVLSDTPPPADRLRTTQAELEDVVRRAPGNGQAWSDLAYATALLAAVEMGRELELGRLAEAAADRALRSSTDVFEFWVRRGVARNLQGRWAEAGEDFSRALTLAPASVTAWYYYADHLSRSPTQHALAAGALAFCLRLDPTHRQAIALRQRLAMGARAP